MMSLTRRRCRRAAPRRRRGRSRRHARRRGSRRRRGRWRHGRRGSRPAAWRRRHRCGAEFQGGRSWRPRDWSPAPSTARCRGRGATACINSSHRRRGTVDGAFTPALALYRHAAWLGCVLSARPHRRRARGLRAVPLRAARGVAQPGRGGLPSRKLVQPTAYMSRMSAIEGPRACGMNHPFKIAAFAEGSVGLASPVTLACPIVPTIEFLARRGGAAGGLALFRLRGRRGAIRLLFLPLAQRPARRAAVGPARTSALSRSTSRRAPSRLSR